MTFLRNCFRSSSRIFLSAPCEGEGEGGHGRGWLLAALHPKYGQASDAAFSPEWDQEIGRETEREEKWSQREMRRRKRNVKKRDMERHYRDLESSSERDETGMQRQRAVCTEGPGQTEGKHTETESHSESEYRQTDTPRVAGKGAGRAGPPPSPGPAEGLSTLVTLSQKILIWQTARCTRRSVPEPQS